MAEELKKFEGKTLKEWQDLMQAKKLSEEEVTRICQSKEFAKFLMEAWDEKK